MKLGSAKEVLKRLGEEAGTEVSVKQLNLVIAKVTGKMHPYYLRQFRDAMECIGAITQNSNTVKINFTENDLE